MKQEAELKYSHDLINLTANELNDNVMGMGAVYVPVEKTELWIGSNYVKRYANYKVNINPNKLKRETIYKKCKKTGDWYSGNNFMMSRMTIKRKSGNIPGFTLHSRIWKHDSRNMDDPVNKAKRNKYIQEIQKKNSRFIKYWMYGTEEHDVTCLVSGTVIKKQIRNPFKKGPRFLSYGTYYLHHFLVRNGISVLKETKPSELMKKASLLNNVDAVRDLLGTILINDDSHKKIHSLSSNSDLQMYRKAVIPYGLKSEVNFNKVAAEFPILKQIDYKELMKSLNL